MGKIRRGNFVFITWKGDHGPYHVRVFRDGRLVVKWNLESDVPIEGKADARILSMIADLRREGQL